ncbi:MAG: hypothetical protein MdMp024_1261 [Bacteroidales bacterium]
MQSFKQPTVWTWKDVDEAYLGTLATAYPGLARYIAGVGSVRSIFGKQVFRMRNGF